MNEIVKLADATFALSSVGHPELFRTAEAKLDALISVAAKLHEWELLERAVKAKVGEQAEFVHWWDATVGTRHGLNRHNVENAVLGSLSKADAEARTGVTQQQVSRWRKSLGDPVRYCARIILATYRQANLTPPENHRAVGTGLNEWFTPAEYIAAAREVMGTIDLDPATHPVAQQIVCASSFYTREDDGLSKPWHGSVWLNPPYARGEIYPFVDKLLGEFTATRMTQGVMLTHAYTDTAWFHLAERSAARLCFTEGRIRFVDIDNEECAPTQGQAFFYFGSEVEKFRDVFSKFGFVR
jgi:phage N-6-adenine-methyltransferase